MCFSGFSIGCPDHQGQCLIEDGVAGDLICQMCGIVVLPRAIDVTEKHESNSNEGCSTFGLEAGQYKVNEVLRCHENAELKRKTQLQERRIKELEEELKVINKKIKKIEFEFKVHRLKSEEKLKSIHRLYRLQMERRKGAEAQKAADLENLLVKHIGCVYPNFS
ncbi:uncharacterized protein LOC136042659 [Artemia franciscana]|uniref:uncharacterized protein LOC136042659 n=1 Tax=Artemia franciscana TaxID=6661 RepID=UPI0032DBBF74